MKSRTMTISRYNRSRCVLVTLALATLALAQSKPPADYPRFEAIDLGTFGGPNGNVSAGAIVISPDGTVTSAVDTSEKISCNHPINQTDCYELHGFSWRDGTLVDLG